MEMKYSDFRRASQASVYKSLPQVSSALPKRVTGFGGGENT